MYCRLCQKHNTKSLNGSSKWNKEGYACKRLNKVKDHEQGEQHRQEFELETRQQLGIEKAINQESITKCLKFLLQHNIPYTDIFKALIHFATHELHAPDLQHLSVGSDAKYTSHRMVDEFIDTMAEHMEDAVYTNIKSSSAYSIMAAESTDVSNRKHRVFSARYIDVVSGELQTEFVKDVEYGVATRLKELKPNIINIHYITLFRDVDDTLTHVFKHYHYSAVRTKSLEKIQELLNDAEETKTIKNAFHTRWLSHLNATLKMQQQAVQTIGTDKVRIESGPSASGLLKKIKNAATIKAVHFCFTIYTMTLGRLKEKEGVNTTKSSEQIKKINVTWKPNELESVHTAEKKFIDGLVSNITTRLQNTEVIDKFTIFRKNIPVEVKNGFYGNDEIMDLAEHLKLDVDETLYQWDLFKTSIVDNSMDLLTGPTATTKGLLKMEKTLGNIYSNILKISSAAAAVLPLSTAEVERMFSQVFLQNRTKVEKMNKLLMITQNNKYIDFQAMIDK
ncbi:hypothetical protein ACJMK2_001167 [Sinanodonta woodiana]|uniref:HAT C-terminal dimerisation domain-containing protein n=1 Tax=Sinanodonta woodiana TaxID=1069815 RepID=A0ABD3XRW9_SINWO